MICFVRICSIGLQAIQVSDIGLYFAASDLFSFLKTGLIFAVSSLRELHQSLIISWIWQSTLEQSHLPFLSIRGVWFGLDLTTYELSGIYPFYVTIFGENVLLSLVTPGPSLHHLFEDILDVNNPAQVVEPYLQETKRLYTRSLQTIHTGFTFTKERDLSSSFKVFSSFSCGLQ